MSLVVACLTSKFSKGNSRSLADDLVTGQGDVFSRAASTLRSVESQPLVGRLVSPGLMSLHRSPNACALSCSPPPPQFVTSTICNILRNISPPPSILRPSSLFCAIHKTVETHSPPRISPQFTHQKTAEYCTNRPPIFIFHPLFQICFFFKATLYAIRKMRT